MALNNNNEIIKKCCYELSKFGKEAETNFKLERLGTPFFIWMVDFYSFVLLEWREECDNYIINCSNCSQFKDKIPIGTIMLNFSLSQQYEKL